MTKMPALSMFTATALLIVTLWSQPGYAGTSFAVSGPASIDTRHPVVSVTDLPLNTVLWSGQVIALDWTLSDDNPSGAAGANLAQMWLGDLLYESRPFDATTSPHTWQWTVPDTTSGTAHLVVRSADAYGNLTVARAADFTILSAATDVPTSVNLPVFALPAPNPFNPLTHLRFSLPEPGPVQVTVHDARGFRVGTLLQTQRPAGPFSLRWNGTDDVGRRQAGGTYFFRLEYRQEGQVRRIVRKAVLLP